MKYLKMLGLAAFAALALMALGVGTASATKLCTDEACATVYPVGTEIHASLRPSSTFRLTSPANTTVATCTTSTIKGKTSNKEGATVSGPIEALTWGSAGTECTVTTDTVAFGSFEIEKTGANEGKVVGKGTEVTYKIFGTTCTYGTGLGTILGTIKGGVEPVLVINNANVVKTAGNFLCPSTAFWDAEYIVTSPHAMFIG